MKFDHEVARVWFVSTTHILARDMDLLQAEECLDGLVVGRDGVFVQVKQSDEALSLANDCYSTAFMQMLGRADGRNVQYILFHADAPEYELYAVFHW